MDADLAAEIAAHLEMEAAEQRAAGLGEAEARAAAHRVFGNASLALEDSRAAWGWAGAESLVRDLRLAALTALMLREAAAFGGVGWLAGLAAACALPRLIPAAFSGISYTLSAAGAVLVLSGLLIAAVALAASWLPARRAARMDPNQALRWE